MQVIMLEAKTQLSRLVEAALRGEEVVIANRRKAVVRLVKIEAPVKRIAGAWAGLMTDAEIDHAFDAGLKPRRRAAKKVARKPAR